MISILCALVLACATNALPFNITAHNQFNASDRILSLNTTLPNDFDVSASYPDYVIPRDGGTPPITLRFGNSRGQMLDSRSASSVLGDVLEYVNAQLPFDTVQSPLPVGDYTYLRFDFANRAGDECSYGYASKAIAGLREWGNRSRYFYVTRVSVIVEMKVLAVMGFTIKSGPISVSSSASGDQSKATS